jgi:prolycopene isomerase
VSVTVPTLADPSLAPSGEHLVMLTALVRHDAASWRDRKADMTSALVEIADRYVGGLASHLRFSEGATPRTLERYTRNSSGALYGWELSPRNVGPGRPGAQTPIEGLHLTGHWTQPGGGIYGVVTSGVQTARAILGHRRESDLWDSLARV